MITLFKQVNKAGSIFLLDILVMGVVFTACVKNEDVLADTRPDQLRLMACPPDCHNFIQEQFRVPAGGKQKPITTPILIKGLGASSSLCLTNCTGSNLSTQDMTIAVRVKGLFAQESSLFKLTLGKVRDVTSGTKQPLSKICGSATMQPTRSINFTIADLDPNPSLLSSSSLHFHLIIEGSGIQQIEQEVIWELY